MIINNSLNNASLRESSENFEKKKPNASCIDDVGMHVYTHTHTNTRFHAMSLFKGIKDK